MNQRHTAGMALAMTAREHPASGSRHTRYAPKLNPEGVACHRQEKCASSHRAQPVMGARALLSKTKNRKVGQDFILWCFQGRWHAFMPRMNLPPSLPTAGFPDKNMQVSPFHQLLPKSPAQFVTHAHLIFVSPQLAGLCMAVSMAFDMAPWLIPEMGLEAKPYPTTSEPVVSFFSASCTMFVKVSLVMRQGPSKPTGSL